MKTIKFAERFIPLIEDGSKTQTRRVIEPQPETLVERDAFGCDLYRVKVNEYFHTGQSSYLIRQILPKFASPYEICSDNVQVISVSPDGVETLTDLFIEVAAVRAERLREISHNDVYAEGVDTGRNSEWNQEHPLADGYSWTKEHPIDAFQQLWVSIYGQESWDRNDWIWAITFKRIDNATD